MPTLKLYRRFFILAVLTVVFGIAGHERALAQDSASYIQFLEQNSMLFQADQEASTISGMGVQWQHHYGNPITSQAVQMAPVWLLYYPGSVITKPGQSVLGLWGDTQYWDTLQKVGIAAQHTNPIQSAGGLCGTTLTPTIDGWFDRISLNIDSQFGSEDEYKQMVKTAGDHGAIIGSDLVPLHTGLGADFRLAERAYADYPGLYTMVEIPPSLWKLLPPVTDPCGTALLPVPAAVQLKNMGYIPGTIHSADADPAAQTWSGWSATPEVVGVDGATRRWVYLHVFKPAQPTMNWMDPSFAAYRVEFGDTARHIVDRGTKFLRLDAAPFLSIDPDTNDAMAQTYLQPLSIDGTNDLAYMARKLGGFTYQELNVPVEQLKQYTQYGPDISYDFFTRAEYFHPLITGNVLPLRLEHSLLLQQGVQVGTMVHDLQNHDEITYQLINLGAHTSITLDGQTYNGAQLKQQMLQQMQSTVGAVPYNKLYRPQKDGIATTVAGFIAPALGIKDPYHATPDQVALIRRAHLLLAHANAMIPGVFAISAWDLTGALPVAAASVANLINTATSTNDWRWVNRGAVDLLGVNPSANKSTVLGLPKATTLYGPLPQQLQDPNSFASQIMKMLAARKQYNIPGATMNAVPPVSDPAVCVLEMTLPTGDFAITALNYGRNSTSVQVDLTLIPPGIPASQVAGQTAQDIVANQSAGTVGSDGKLTINLDNLSGKTLVVHRVGAVPIPPPTNSAPGPTVTSLPGSSH
jgi:maltose alpha-D-glucosyltransferase/alpha-amylase